jgi:hypothetical protein
LLHIALLFWVVTDALCCSTSPERLRMRRKKVDKGPQNSKPENAQKEPDLDKADPTARFRCSPLIPRPSSAAATPF